MLEKRQHYLKKNNNCESYVSQTSVSDWSDLPRDYYANREDYTVLKDFQFSFNLQNSRLKEFSITEFDKQKIDLDDFTFIPAVKNWNAPVTAYAVRAAKDNKTLPKKAYRISYQKTDDTHCQLTLTRIALNNDDYLQKNTGKRNKKQQEQSSPVWNVEIFDTDLSDNAQKQEVFYVNKNKLKFATDKDSFEQKNLLQQSLDNSLIALRYGQMINLQPLDYFECSKGEVFCFDEKKITDKFSQDSLKAADCIGELCHFTTTNFLIGKVQIQFTIF